MAKEILFNIDARDQLKKGVDKRPSFKLARHDFCHIMTEHHAHSILNPYFLHRLTFFAVLSHRHI